MQKKYLLYSLFIILFSGCKKEELGEVIPKLDYEQYSSVGPQIKVGIINDSFIDNRNEWHWIDTSFKGDVDTYPYSSGVLLSEGGIIMSGKGSLVELSISYDSLTLLSNFELEAEVKFVKNRPNKDMDSTSAYIMLTWGFNDFNENINYILLANYPTSQKVGYYKDWYTTFPFEFPAIKGNQFNKLTIRKVDKQLYYFINEQFIGKYALQTITGNRIGFRTNSHSVYTIKNFTFKKF
jgi:hypothetical protein